MTDPSVPQTAAPGYIANLSDEEGAILAFALWKTGLTVSEATFREAWHRFIRLRAASGARTIRRALERELEEFSDVLERTKAWPTPDKAEEHRG